MTIRKFLKSVTAFALCAVMVLPQIEVCNAQALTSFALNENYESGSCAFPASFTDNIVLTEGDGTNTSKFVNVKTSAGYYNLPSAINGTVVFEFRAKNNGTGQWGSCIRTRDGGSGETWNRSMYFYITDTAWKYYRVIVNYSDRSIDLYSSSNGFMNLAPATLGTVQWGKDSTDKYASGVKSIRFENIAFDDLKIYQKPAAGGYYTDLKDNSLNVSKTAETKFFFVDELDTSTLNADNIYFEDAVTGDTHTAVIEPYAYGFTVRPQEPLDYETEYYLKAENLALKDPTAVDDIEISFTTQERVYDVFIEGTAEVGKTLTADIDTYSEESDLRIEWLKSDSEDGDYTVIDGENEVNYTVDESDDNYYIMFKLYSGEDYLSECKPVQVVTPLAPTEISYIENEDFEGGDFLWKSSREERRVFGDSVNPTAYRKAVSGYITLSKEVKGNVIMEFMAKGTGSWISVTTRQNSDYQKTIRATLQPSFVSRWGYYRIILDCDNKTGKVYWSDSSFTEMTETNIALTYSNSDGFNQLEIANCYLDNLRILYQPASGKFLSSIANGKEDGDIEKGIEFLFYEPMNEATEITENVQLINTTDGLSEKTLTNVGMFGFRIVPSYSDIYNKSFECVLSENIKNDENTAINRTRLSFKTAMEKLKDSITVERHALLKNGDELTAFNETDGDIGARLVLSNNKNVQQQFIVVTALFRNSGSVDMLESYNITDVTLEAGAENVQVDTETPLSVPEHSAGSYSIKIFIWDSVDGKTPLAEQITYNAVGVASASAADAADDGLEIDCVYDEPNGEFTLNAEIGTNSKSRIGYIAKDPEGKLVYIGQVLNENVAGQFQKTAVLPSGAVAGIYHISAADTKGFTDDTSFVVSVTNIKPKALDVYISGNPVMGSVVQAEYSVYHPNVVSGDVSEFRWYRASEKDGGYTLIPDAAERTYTLTSEDAAKYIKCAVIPKLESVSSAGDEVKSEGVKIAARPIATNLSIKGTVKEGQTVTADYNYYDADGKGETAATVITWYVDGSAVSTGATYKIPSGYAGRKLSFTIAPGADGANGSGDPVTSKEVTISSAGSGGGGGGEKQVSINGDITVQPTPVETVKSVFGDIENHWAKEIIEQLAKEGIIKGKSEGKFAPDDSITRAEYAALIVRIAKLTAEDSAEAFTDITQNDWFFDVVNAAKQHGLIDGFEGRFRPNDSITRQEATAIIYRLCKLQGKEAAEDTKSSRFADSGDIAQWAAEGIEFSAAIGIILGDENNNFRPNANLSRAEAAAILSRI